MVTTDAALLWRQDESEMARLIRQHDWAETPLGPVDAWPEKLRTVVELMLESPQIASVTVGPERLLLYNDAAARLYRAHHPGVLGQSLSDAFPESYPDIAHLYDRAFAGNAVEVPSRPVAVSQGGGEVFEASLLPIRVDGAVLAVLMIGNEVSARWRAEAALRESEARQAFLLRLSDALRPLAEPAEVQQAASRLLGDYLDVSRTMYAEVHDAGKEAEGLIRGQHVREGDPFPERFPYKAINEGFTDKTMRTNGRVVVGDVASDPRIGEDVRQLWLSTGVAAVVAVPLVKNGRVVCIFGVHNARAREWSPGEVTLIEDVAERTWTAAERARAEAALRTSGEHFRTIVGAVRDYAIFTTDVEGRIDTWPAGAEAVFGWSEKEALDQLADMTFTPEDRANGAPRKERADARAKGHAADVRWHLRKDGAKVFIEGVVRPLTGSNGTVTGFLKVGQDVTARRTTEDALRESEARFRQFGEASADVLWIRDCESLAFEYVSPAFETIYGTKIDDVLGGNHIVRWVEMIVPEDRDKVLDALRRVRNGEQLTHSFRILRGDGQIRWIRNTDFPLIDGEGRVQRIGGITHDTTEEVELQDRLQVLVAELQHRSRNLVGVTQAITERTLATSETLEEFRGRFRPRLDALGRVNGLLSRLEEGDRITFDQLLQTEFAAHGILDGESSGTAISLQGPIGIRLPSATVQTFALALHELTTNALKYGALSRPDSQLRVTWQLVPGKGTERRLKVDWHETGISAPDPDSSQEPLLDRRPTARRRGYGRELIERALPYQLKAETSYDLTPDGVRCTIIVPVSRTLDVAFSSQEEIHD